MSRITRSAKKPKARVVATPASYADDDDDDYSDHGPPSSTSTAITMSTAIEPAFFPFQLSDEQYARILRDPEAYDYPLLPPGRVKRPILGHIYVELRAPGVRRPKLVDGFDWVPSSTANASSQTLADGVTQLLRYYCARRTKSVAAKPAVKPFNIFQRAVYDDVRDEHPGASGYEIKSRVGERWRALSEVLKKPFLDQAKKENAQARKRMSSADPAELLVRHEMWLQGGPDTAATVGGNATRVLVHYLGDDAFHQMSIPPRPIKIVDGGSSKGKAGGGAAATSKEGEESLYSDETGSTIPDDPYTLGSDVETSSLQLFLGCSRIVPKATVADDEDEDDEDGLASMPPLRALPPPPSTKPPLAPSFVARPTPPSRRGRQTSELFTEPAPPSSMPMASPPARRRGSPSTPLSSGLFAGAFDEPPTQGADTPHPTSRRSGLRPLHQPLRWKKHLATAASTAAGMLGMSPRKSPSPKSRTPSSDAMSTSAPGSNNADVEDALEGAAGLSPIGADWFEAFTNDTSPTAAQMMLTFEGGNTPTAPPA